MLTLTKVLDINNEKEMESKILNLVFLSLNNILLDVTNNYSEINLVKVFCQFIKIGFKHYKVLLNQFSNIHQIIKQISQNKDLNNQTRQFSLEFLISICENISNIINENDIYISNILELSFQMIEIENINIKEWNYQILHIKANHKKKSEHGQLAIEKLCISLGMERIIPLLEIFFRQFFKKENWSSRYISLITLTKVTEYLNWKTLKSICSKIMFYSIDRHPIMRLAYINFVKICINHSIEFRCQFSDQIIQNLILLMEDEKNPYIQICALSELINFFKLFKSIKLIPFLSNLFRMIGNLLRSKFINIQEQGIDAISRLAQNVRTNFRNYYHLFIQVLFKILKVTIEPNQQSFIGKTCQAITFIGLAVGKEMFNKDAKSFMQFTFNLLQSGANSKNFIYPLLIHSWARIAQCLQNQFNPFIPIIIPILRKHINENIIPLKHERKKKIFFQDNTIKYYSSILIGIIAQSCDKQWLNQLIPIFLDNDVNEISIMTILNIISSAKKKHGKTALETIHIFNQCFEKLVNRITIHKNLETSLLTLKIFRNMLVTEKFLIKSFIYQNPKKLRNILFNLFVTIKNWGLICELLINNISNSKVNKYKLKFLQDELKIYDKLMEYIFLVIGKLFSLFNNILHFKKLIMDIIELLWINKQKTYKKNLISLISDLFNNVSVKNLQYCFHKLIQIIIEAIDMLNYPRIVKKSFITLGLIGTFDLKFHRQYIYTICRKSLKTIDNYPKTKFKQNYFNLCSKYKCISLLIRICYHQKEVRLLEKNLKLLPLNQNSIEAKKSHRIFAKLIGQQEFLIFGRSFEHLPRIIKLVFYLLSKTKILIDGYTEIFFLRQFLLQLKFLPASSFYNLIMQLSIEENYSLQKILTKY